MKISPLFSVILAVSLLFCIRPVGSSPSKFSWLKVGSYATYSFNSEMRLNGVFGFDDHALATAIVGKYTWRCVELSSDYSTLELELDFTVPKNESVPYGHVTYAGKESVQRAREGDFSFMKRIPIDQVRENKIEFIGDLVYVWGPLHIYKKLVITVDLNTLELVDGKGKAWGRWAMWINPTKYPLVASRVPETFIFNWLNNTVELYASYNNGTFYPPIDTALGEFKRYFLVGGTKENKFLLELGGMGMSSPEITLTYVYEPRSGILLTTATKQYLDDVLTQKLGVIYTSGVFALLETNVSFKEDNALDISSYVPYLAILAISATIAAAYFVKEKKLIKKR